MRKYFITILSTKVDQQIGAKLEKINSYTVELRLNGPSEATQAIFDKIGEVLGTKKSWQSNKNDKTVFSGDFDSRLQAIGSLRHAGFSIFEE